MNIYSDILNIIKCHIKWHEKRASNKICVIEYKRESHFTDLSQECQEDVDIRIPSTTATLNLISHYSTHFNWSLRKLISV